MNACAGFDECAAALKNRDQESGSSKSVNISAPSRFPVEGSVRVRAWNDWEPEGRSFCVLSVGVLCTTSTSLFSFSFCFYFYFYLLLLLLLFSSESLLLMYARRLITVRRDATASIQLSADRLAFGSSIFLEGSGSP